MSKYFSLSSAWGEVTSTNGTEKATAVAKLVGKSASNTLIFGVTELIPGMFKASAKSNHATATEALRSKDLTAEQREKYHEVQQKSQEFLDRADQMGQRFDSIKRSFKANRTSQQDRDDDNVFNNDDTSDQRFQR